MNARRFAIWSYVALAIILAGGVIGALLAPIDHDVAWHLYAAERILDGDRLYVHLVEYNLPAAYYLPVPAIALAKRIGLSSPLVFKLAILAAIAVSLGLCRGRILAAGLHRAGWPILSTVAFLLLVGVGGNFGQREHVVAIFMVPYVLSVISRLERAPPRPSTAAIIGLLGGVGAVLKPFYLIVWLAVDSYLIATRGFRFWRSRLELGTLVLVLLITALATLHFLRDYLPVAHMARLTLSAYNRPLHELLRQPVPLFGGAILAIAIIRLLSSGPAAKQVQHRSAVAVTTLATAAVLITAILQMKGWGYHFYLVIAFGGLLFTLLVFERWEPSRVTALVPSFSQLASTWMVLLLAATAVKLTDSFYDRIHLRNGVFGELLRVAQSIPDGSPILVLSSSMYPAFPLVIEAQTGWACRYPFLWPLPGLHRSETDGAPHEQARVLASMRRSFINAVISDLAARQPELIIVDNAPIKQGFGNRRFDYLEYLARDGRFSAIWARYEPIGTAGTYALFRKKESARIPARAASH